ncbi:MAG TPA: oxidoreductase [Mycobacteriales bacterium]
MSPFPPYSRSSRSSTARSPGFRAATGRNARIRRRAYHLRAARRGLATSLVGLAATTVLTAVALAFTAHAGQRYDGLVHAGTRMLGVLLPFAGVVVLSLAAYFLLPMRESAFVILIGLGPFTLLRRAVVVGAAAWSVVGSTDWFVWGGTIVAATGVLAIEPWVHRCWYRTPI